MIQLDTSFLIHGLVRGSGEDQLLREWLSAGETLAASAIAWAEFLCGPLEGSHLQLASRVVTHRLPFAEEDAALAAELFNDSGRRRGSFVDCLIAAVALRSGAPLATSNPSDFERFAPAGLEVLGV